MNRLAQLVRQRVERDRDLVHDKRPLLEWAKHFLPEHTERPFSDLHRWLATQCDQATQLRGQKINLVGPRGSAKSTIVSLAYLLKRACEGDEPYIWLLSDTKGQAHTHLENIRHELADNTRLRAAYGAHNLARHGQWTEERIQLANGTTIEAYGTGQRLRGRRRGARRPTLIICDDLQNDSHALSAQQRLNSKQWFTGTLLKAGRPTTNIINIGTALHREALAMQLHETPGWRSKLFAAIQDWPTRMDLWQEWETIYNQPENPAAADRAAEFYDRNHAEMHRGARLLWPDEEPLYYLMRMRVEEGSTAFEREKQSSPIDPERCEWPSEYFLTETINYTVPPPPETILCTALALDPSKSKVDRRGDFSAYVIVQLTTTGILYVNAELVRESAPALVHRGVRLIQTWRPNLVGIETNAYQELLVAEFDRQLTAAGVPLTPIIQLDNTVHKILRIRRIGPFLSQKRIKFFMQNPYTRELVHQLQEFPIASHDDGPDALEMAIRLLEQHYQGFTPIVSRMKLAS